MIASKHTFLKAFFLANCLGLGAVHAAAVFNPDAQPIGYVGMPEVTSNIVTSGAEQMFSLDYNSQEWSGNLHSYQISNTGAIGTSDAWIDGAAGQLDQQNVSSGTGTWNATGRRIVTMNGTAVPFLWESLSAAQKDAIDPATAAVSGSTSSPVLNFIRGDRSNEAPNGNDYRARSTVMGDIIHSTPVYCNAATCGSATVFVGANDGMLHAINASDGSERFAYIPSMLIPKLKDLAVDPYVHKYFVDGNMDIRKFGSMTILAGALGSGGKGLFALDVSNAASASESDAASKILWEATNTGSYANLGHTYGQPRLATLNGGTGALIVGNGYNNTGNGHSSLFVIDADTGTVLHEIDAGSGTLASPNGLSSPTLVDADVDGDVDIAYAGDIDGNLWKFDLVANTSTLLYSQSQAITMAPGVRAHPNGGFMVTFVTGRMFTSGTGSDETDSAIHFAYGIWDRPAAYSANDTLLVQTLTEVDYTEVSPSFKVRKATSLVPDWTPGAGHHKGWKTALPPGERVVGDGAYVTGSIFLFMSTNPTASTDATPPYENWWMQLNALTGGDNGSIRFDLNGDAAFTSADQLTGGISPVGRHMGGGIRSQLTELNTASFNVYHANYDKNGDPVVPVDERGVANGHFDVEIYYDFANKCPATGSKASGSVTFNYASSRTEKNVTGLTITANGETVYTGSNLGNLSPRGLVSFLNGRSSANYSISGSGSTITISAKNVGTAYNGSITVTLTTSGSAPGYSKNNLTGGTEVGATSSCSQVRHVHEYDDVYDKTGLNMLDASDTTYDLANAIPSTTTEFKVIAQNQYLSPALNLHIGNSAYRYDVNAGYIPIKNFTTSTDLDLSALPTYTRANVGSLAFNMPVEAFEQRDWWNGALGLPADVRVGLHPTQYECVIRSTGSQDGNMFQPVIPPGTMGTADSADGNGVRGYNSGTNSLTATGVRHNGALTIQIIRANTPQSAIEMSIPSHPEYGWRVKSQYFGTYVLAEYSTFWHDKGNAGRCYGTAGWTKLTAPDTRPCGTRESTTEKICSAERSAANGTDPKIGAFGSGSGSGSSGSSDVVSTTVTNNADGTVTVVTTYRDGTTSTTVIDHGVSTGGAVSGGGINLGGVTTPPEVLGRVNWRELRQ